MAIADQVLLQNAATATGNGNVMRVQGAVSAVLDVVISNTATVTFEAAGPSGTWTAVQVTNMNAGTAVTTATASGLFRMNVAGLSRIRARVSAYTNGTVTVYALAVSE